MRKTIFAFVGVMAIGGAFAAKLSERVNCVETKSRIDTLAANENLNDSDKALLTDLRASYRSNCTARAAGRGTRTIAAKRVEIKDTESKTIAPIAETEVASEEQEVIIAESCSNPDANGCCPGEVFESMDDGTKYCCKDDVCFPPMEVKPAAPQKTEEEIAAEITANLEKGLCGDGTKPNKFGCCSGELFKDLGNSEFGCCKKDTDECFPPIK